MSKRILLADDSLTIQKVVELTFMDEDFEVEAVGSGDEAINRLGEDLPSILIADVHMPGASGYEVCRQAKAMSAELPVLLLVGTFEALDEDEMVACGADGNLKKPFDSQELLQVVQRMTSGEPPSRSEAPIEDSPPAQDSLEGSEAPEFEAPGFEVPEPELPESEAPEYEPTSHDEDRAVEPPELPVTGFDLGGGGLGEDAGPDPAEELEGEPEIEPVDLGDSADYRKQTAEPASGNETVFTEALPASAADEEFDIAADPETWEEPDTADEAAEDSSAAAADDEPEQAPEPVSPGSGGLSDADVDRVARRVVELMSDDAVREVAWDVIPDLAEVVIKDRIRELESEAD